MKNSILKGLTATAIILSTFAFTTMKKDINIPESQVTWKGKKITGSHTGTINFEKGFLNMEGETITGGEFVIDMTSITVTDLKAGSGKEKLEGHLKSDDFFGVENYPTSKLVIKNATKTDSGYVIDADITIKGITESINFDLIMAGNTATTSLKIDRTKFGVRYGSGSFFDNLGDNTIYDNFALDVTLQF